MSTCTRLECCLPDPFAANTECEKTQYLSARIELTCGTGSITSPIVVEAGLFSSFDSQDDADNKAQAYATVLRQTSPCQWTNTEQTATATCTPPLTGSSTVVIPAGTYTSETSQAAANALALAAAQTQAQETLVCT